MANGKSDDIGIGGAHYAVTAHADGTTVTARPILILSRFFSNWIEKSLRPLSKMLFMPTGGSLTAKTRHSALSASSLRTWA
jgi:hypothetical protein